ncbi:MULTISPECIES: hypothetical protein [Mycobacteriaceae]|uniref:Uncharacterized protein n=1 Tax=Mycolicibacterium mucogenicum TaxID=56689 RepID=A0A4R5WKA3_MYCMU|nr:MULTISPECIES: hypothetical protein [Mycolicibacterium]TDK91326.1 hypothetical protein EUA03_08625 [Mycolicibacterium mucogenicum]GCB00726.1 hypothetical protein NCCNTM_43600 [Mycolicibacterium sp. NCC-Tsukiji]
MSINKFAIVAAGALSFAAIGLGAGQANADNTWWWIPAPSPGQVGQLFGVPPGQIGHLPFVPPPGHWNKPGKWIP